MKRLLLLATLVVFFAGCATQMPVLEGKNFLGGSFKYDWSRVSYEGGGGEDYSDTLLVGEGAHFIAPNIALGGMLTYDRFAFGSGTSTIETSRTGIGPAIWVTFPETLEDPILPYVSGYLGFDTYGGQIGTVATSDFGNTLRLAGGVFIFCGKEEINWAIKAEVFFSYTTFGDDYDRQSDVGVCCGVNLFF